MKLSLFLIIAPFYLLVPLFPQQSEVISKAVPCLNIEKTKAKAKEALAFCKEKNFNTQFCVLIDMSLHSGVKRFVVWDYKADSISNIFMVSHGCCDNPWCSDASKEAPAFSNVEGSHCSSLGKYKLGKRAWSEWGINIKYEMHGLEATNKNALSRLIVFHSWDKVTDEELYPQGTVEGWGCPTISNNSMLILDPKIKGASKPVMMWIYK